MCTVPAKLYCFLPAKECIKTFYQETETLVDPVFYFSDYRVLRLNIDRPQVHRHSRLNRFSSNCNINNSSHNLNSSHS
jgi:hypothetical protein